MSKLTLHYVVVTPERLVFEGDAESISIMTSTGEITVLPHHIPLLTLMKAGEMRVRKGGELELLATSTGMFEVRQDGSVVVLADTAERVEELELSAIDEARKRAEAALVEARHRNDVSYADAAAHLEREIARYRVAMKKGKVRQHRREE